MSESSEEKQKKKFSGFNVTFGAIPNLEVNDSSDIFEKSFMEYQDYQSFSRIKPPESLDSRGFNRLKERNLVTQQEFSFRVIMVPESDEKEGFMNTSCDIDSQDSQESLGNISRAMDELNSRNKPKSSLLAVDKGLIPEIKLRSKSVIIYDEERAMDQLSWPSEPNKSK